MLQNERSIRRQNGKTIWKFCLHLRPYFYYNVETNADWANVLLDASKSVTLSLLIHDPTDETQNFEVESCD